jgi:hypothetical protein
MVRASIQAGGRKPAKPVKPKKDPIIGFLENTCGCVPPTPSSPTLVASLSECAGRRLLHSLVPHCATCAPQG